MKYKIIIIFILSSKIGLSQYVEPDFITKYKTNINFDSLIRTKSKVQVDNSYFVITYPLLGASTSWAPQFISTYESIRKRKEKIIIVFFNNGGLLNSEIPLFMKEILKVPDKDLNKVRYIANDSLYNILTEKRYLVRLQYYFRRNLYYNESEKWQENMNQVFPSEHFNLVLENKLKLKNTKDKLIKLSDAVFPFDSNNVLILTDTRNQIFKVNLTDGTITDFFRLADNIKASELYCKFINNDDKCNFAKLKEGYVDSTNRQTIIIKNIVRINTDSLLFTIEVEVLERSESPYTFINDIGKRTTIAEDDYSLDLYNFFGYYNIKTNLINYIKIEEIKNKKGEEKYLMMGQGLGIVNNSILTNINGFGKKDFNTISLVKFKMVGNLAIPEIIKYPQSIYSKKMYAYFSKSFFYEFNNQIYFSFNTEPDIYVIGRQKKQSSFIGDGNTRYKNEELRKFIEDNSVSPKVNFLIHAIKPIYNSTYLAAYINYKNNHILEIKNRMFKTLDIIPLSSFTAFANYDDTIFREDVLIINNKLILKSIENDEMYLNIFSIMPVDK